MDEALDSSGILASQGQQHQRARREPTKVTSFRNSGTSSASNNDDWWTKAVNQPEACRIKVLPSQLTTENTGLSDEQLALIHKKQKWLMQYHPIVPGSSPKTEEAVNATLVFAQEEAGTAVCISPAGIILTCSHCVAETMLELDPDAVYWLLFASGQVVKARYLSWESKPDLALLKIIAAQEPEASLRPNFPSIVVADTPPKLRSWLACIGHPGSEDLEASMPGIQTNYNVLCVSTGRFQGHAAGQNLHDNSEIGALMHDCWTYWGHSGAPLVNETTGELVGLHSSWDEETGMRRGIPLVAIQSCLQHSFDNIKYHEEKSWVG